MRTYNKRHRWLNDVAKVISKAMHNVGFVRPEREWILEQLIHMKQNIENDSRIELAGMVMTMQDDTIEIFIKVAEFWEDEDAGIIYFLKEEA